ncbi:hypothetical protein [Fulvivirga sp. M361]|nr:hypothetical protein [Fulvivirga sp. M361]
MLKFFYDDQELNEFVIIQEESTGKGLEPDIVSWGGHGQKLLFTEGL